MVKGADREKKQKAMEKEKKQKHEAKKKGSMLKSAVITRYVLFIVLAAVAAVSPLFRGLYFEEELLPFEIAVFGCFVLFWAYKFIKKDRRLVKTPLDLSLLGLVLAYLLSTVFSAVGTRLAVGEWLKYSMYFALLLMFSELADNIAWRKALMWALTAAGTVVAVFGLDGASGSRLASIVNRFYMGSLGGGRELIFSTFDGARIHSTIQYPNTLAAYLGTVFFISVGLALLSRRVWAKVLAGALGSVLMAAFILTLSRGAYIVFALALVPFAAFMPRGRRIEALLHAAFQAVPGAACALFLGMNIGAYSEKAAEFWQVILAGAAASALLSAIAAGAGSLLSRLGWKVYAIAGGLLIVLAAAAAFKALTSMEPLVVESMGEGAKAPFTVTRKAVLEPGERYRFRLTVNADGPEDAPAYRVYVRSKSRKDIIGAKAGTLLAVLEGAGGETVTREEEILVPENSMIVEFQFISGQKEARAEFREAVIEDSVGKEKAIPLKYKYIPESIASRLQGLQASQSGMARGIFYRDGLKIFKEHWLLGAGGGAWSLLYFSKQSYLYFSTLAHNFFLQVGIETGVVGLLFAALLVLSVLITLLTGKPGGEQDRSILKTVLAVSALFMLAHSAIDFNLSLPAVAMLLWSILALYNSLLLEEGLPAGGMASRFTRAIMKPAGMLWKAKLNLHPVLGLIAASVLVVLPSMFFAALRYEGLYRDAQLKGDRELSMAAVEKAMAADPFKAQYRSLYAEMLLYKESPLTGEVLARADSYAKEAERLGKYSADTMTELGAYYLKTGRLDKGLECLDRALVLRPLLPQQWEYKVDAYKQITLLHLEKGEAEKALEWAEKTLEIAGDARKENERNLLPFIFNENTDEFLGKAAYFKENYSGTPYIYPQPVSFYNMPWLDVDLDGSPDQWKALDPSAVSIRARDRVMRVENRGSGTQYVQSRVLNLKAGKKYYIELRLANSIEADSIPFGVTGVSGSSGKLVHQNGVFRGEFQVPADFAGNNSTLLLGVEGVYEIESMFIIEI